MKPLQLLVRDSVAPTLRSRGFKRSHGTFRSVTDDGVAFISISGRGGLGQHEIDCYLEIGFTTHDYLASPQNRAGVRPEQVTITDTYDTWWTRMRDPGLTAMDGNDRWRFNLGDDAMLSLFTTVLEMAADDLLARLRMWPQVPQDSLGQPPVFSGPVEWETRSRWHTDPSGQLDLHYAAGSPVQRRRGAAGDTEFDFDLIHDEFGAMINLGREALVELTGRLPLAEWAQHIGFQSLAGHASLPISPVPDLLRLRQVDAKAVLVIESGPSHPEAQLLLGEFPLPTWTFVNQWAEAQIVLIAGDNDCLNTLTWRTRLGLAKQGKAWWATVPAEPSR